MNRWFKSASIAAGTSSAFIAAAVGTQKRYYLRHPSLSDNKLSSPSLARNLCALDMKSAWRPVCCTALFICSKQLVATKHLPRLYVQFIVCTIVQEMFLSAGRNSSNALPDSCKWRQHQEEKCTAFQSTVLIAGEFT